MGFVFGTAPQPQQKKPEQTGAQPQPGFSFSAAPVSSSQPSAAATSPDKLPSYAHGTDPYGNPYFGEGLQAIGKKWLYNFTKDVKKVDDSQWQALKQRWDDLLKQQNTQHGNKKEGQIAMQTLSLAGQAVSTAWQAGSSDKSVLAPALKFVGASVTALGDLFSIPAQKTEQAFGAGAGFREAANEVASPLPSLDDNPITKFLETYTPLGVAYDWARIALSPSENKWEYTKQKIEEGWQSGRIFYSQVFDKSLKDKFLQEYRSGEDAGIIAMKLQNPLAELGGQLVLDPLNLVGAFGKAVKTAKELEVVEASRTASGLLKTETGIKAMQALENAQDEASSLKAIDQLVLAQREALSTVTSKSKLLNVGYGINDLTTTSRQNGIIAKGKDLLGNMALVLKQNGMSNEGIANMILHGARSVSDDAETMKIGLSGLAHAPNANMWLSDDYLETFKVVNNLLDDGNGALNGSRLVGLMKSSNPAEFADAAQKLMVAAAKSQFADVSELEKAYQLTKQANKGLGIVSEETRLMAQKFEQLPSHVKYMNRIDQTLGKIRNPINSVLSKFYFNFQGGVAVRNIVSNDELILVDKGVGAWFKDGKYWSSESVGKYLNDVFGSLPTGAHGFESLVKSTTGSDKALGFGVLMEKGEQAAALRIVGASVRDTLGKLIPKAMQGMDVAKEVEQGVISQTQVDKFVSMLSRNGGNVEKALSDFRDFYKLGAVEAWRNLDFVTDFERKGLEGLGYWDEVEELARNGAASQADVEAVFEKLRKSIDSRSELATRDVIGLSSDHPGAETWGDLMKAVEEGHLNPDDQQVFTAVMESAEQARLEYQTLLDNVAMKAQDALNSEGKLKEASSIGKQMAELRDKLRRMSPAAAKEANTITQDAWRWSDAVKAEKKPTPQFLKEIWTKAGLNGDPPLDITKQWLLKELWQQRFQKVTTIWNSSLDAVVGESETILKQLGQVVDATELDSMASRTRHITAQAQSYRSATFSKGALKIRPVEDISYVAKQYGVTTEEILNAINNKLPEGTQKFAKVEDVPTKQVMDILEQARQEKGLPEIQGISVPPPHPLTAAPSLPRAWNESATGAKYTLDSIKNKILENWGRTDDARHITPEMETLLKRFSSELSPKMAESKAIALKIADEQRKFTLLNYGEKTYGDIALSYLMPYHFFYTRSYKNWVSRIATNPEIVAGYGKYKNALEGINKDLPPWYKQQLNVTELLGIQTDHPLYFNLEATFNPLYGLTGTDFNDPAKRVDWFTATMDDMGKFGPTMWAPIQMAIAATLYKNGETDAASRWGSRIIPETAQIKAVSSFFGKPIELDPAVQMFSGGGLMDFGAMDPYERGRMGYAASQLISTGQFTAEEVQAQFQAQEGPAWDAAKQQAVNSRAWSSISSYFLGVGFKPRSTNDVTVEKMYTDINKLYATSDTMTPEQYRNEWEKIRSQYPDGLVDSVLLAKKGGVKRDAAYAFNVLGRLPPGQMDDVFKAIGISQKDIDKFYESKGFAASQDGNGKPITWTSTEKDRFMAAIIDLGAMLKIPDSATRGEWNDARNTYSKVYKGIEQNLGSDIWDKVSHYYDLKDDNPEEATRFKDEHPEVIQALQMKREAVATVPELQAYYGGIDSIEAYVSGKIRQKLEDKFGSDIYQIQTDYYNADDPKKYLSQHPELKQFQKEKRIMERESETLMLQMASQLPEKKGAQFQEGFTPLSGVQDVMFQKLQNQPQIQSMETLTKGMPNWLQKEVANYWVNKKELSRRGRSEMDYLAKQNGFYNGADMLRMIGYSLQQTQQQGTPQGAETPQAPAGFQFSP